MCDFSIRTHIINLPEREDRRTHTMHEFEGKMAFDVHIFPTISHKRGAVGLWRSIVHIVSDAKQHGEDAVLICEDDHVFTPVYDESRFTDALFRAAGYGAQLLLGGIGNFRNAVPLDDELVWVDWFWCTQFMVVFSSAYDDILQADFNEEKDVADEFLSSILSNKLVFVPFISEQHDFGYSDVTMSNNRHGTITQHFERAAHKMKAYRRVFDKYGLVKKSKHTQSETAQHPYFATTTTHRLHIGCGTCIKEGWLNVDIKPIAGAEYMDAGRRFPFPCNSFHYIFSEHLIEHLNYFEARNMMDECYRVLRKGGVMRLATPSLEAIIQSIYSRTHHFTVAIWHGQPTNMPRGLSVISQQATHPRACCSTT